VHVIHVSSQESVYDLYIYNEKPKLTKTKKQKQQKNKQKKRSKTPPKKTTTKTTTTKNKQQIQTNKPKRTHFR